MNLRSADLELALAAARAAGALVMRSFGTRHQVTQKGPDQPLTQADLDADHLLQQALAGARPDYGWLSEETVDRPARLDLRRVWIVDPIDGTRSYIAGRPEFAISVGLAEDGAAVLGVVHNPATAELFWAVKGEGAFMARGEGEARRLEVTCRTLEDKAVMLASRSEIRAGEFAPFHGGWRVLPTGSTAYKLARVAAGDGDVFLSRGPKSEWDVCAGALIVEEAGGRATDLLGRAFAYNGPDTYVHGVLATNGLLHGYVLEFIRKLPPPPRLVARFRDARHPGLTQDPGIPS